SARKPPARRRAGRRRHVDGVRGRLERGGRLVGAVVDAVAHSPRQRRDRARVRAPVTPAVETVDLSCRYPGAATPALDRIALALPPRTVTLVMGATGAGKSTLARCIARLVPCFTAADVTGDVRLGGASIVEKSVGELAGVVGMVFQDFEAQLFSTDVTQEIVFGLEQTGVPAGEMPARVAAALAAVGLAGFDRRDPTTLSGGEKQRLAIAGLLALRPDVLLLDEP